ncbi:hypothetical protein [Nannocystis pusilla]|uniref:hypothetical protein n=1 Tax=Nannocystis pusilla TaxID=889268 RepID=UPI003DA55B14
MHLRNLLLPYLALSPLVFGCTPDSKNIGDTLETDSDATATAGDDTEGQSSTGDVTPSTSVASSTGDDPSASDPSVSGTSGVSTTGDDPSDSDPSVSGTSGPDPETTGANTGFDRFTLRTAAGPCPPRADCDGFVELTFERDPARREIRRGRQPGGRGRDRERRLRAGAAGVRRSRPRRGAR